MLVLVHSRPHAAAIATYTLLICWLAAFAAAEHRLDGDGGEPTAAEVALAEELQVDPKASRHMAGT